MKKFIGLALGGGGIKGAAHIGVLRVLEREGLSPHILAGSSIGAIMAGLYGCGYSADEILRITESFATKKPVSFGLNIFLILEIALKWLGKKLKLIDNNVPLPRGIIDNSKIEDYLYQLTAGIRLKDARRPVLITATELHTGGLLVFTSGQKGSIFRANVQELERKRTKRKYPVKVWEDQNLPLATAMIASSSIPGLFTPRKLGEELLVDGGVLNNVPADLLKMAGAELVIAVDLGFTFQDDDKILDPVDVLLQSSDIMGTYITRTRLEGHADVILSPDLSRYGIKDLPVFKEIVREGEKAAEEKLDEIKSLL